jgi:hypothetical protein
MQLGRLDASASYLLKMLENMQRLDEAWVGSTTDADGESP